MLKDLFQNWAWINKTQSLLQVLHPPAAATAVANPARKRARKRLRKDRSTRYWAQLILVLIWFAMLLVLYISLRNYYIILLLWLLVYCTVTLSCLSSTQVRVDLVDVDPPKKPRLEKQENRSSPITVQTSKDLLTNISDYDETNADDFAMEMGLACVVCRSAWVQYVCCLNVRVRAFELSCSSPPQTNDGHHGKPAGGVPGVSQPVPPGLSQAPGDG